MKWKYSGRIDKKVTNMSKVTYNSCLNHNNPAGRFLQAIANFWKPQQRGSLLYVWTKQRIWRALLCSPFF